MRKICGSVLTFLEVSAPTKLQSSSIVVRVMGRRWTPVSGPVAARATASSSNSKGLISRFHNFAVGSVPFLLAINRGSVLDRGIIAAESKDRCELEVIRGRCFMLKPEGGVFTAQHTVFIHRANHCNYYARRAERLALGHGVRNPVRNANCTLTHAQYLHTEPGFIYA